MFMINTPKTFKVGDTIDCRINDAPQRLTWRDENTLIIEPDDARTIVTRVTEGDLICFICGDKGELANEYRVDEVPDHSGILVVSGDNPAGTTSSPFFRKFHARTASDIAQHGRSIICVGAGDDEPPFVYTIGNASRSMPELLAIGTMRGGFLNDLSQMMIDADAAFEDGQIVLIPDADLPVKIIRANKTAHTEYTVQAGQHFGHENYAVMQVLIPDPSGKFPDEAGCQPPFSNFPVLRLS